MFPGYDRMRASAVAAQSKRMTMAIETPTELREHIHDLCRQHKWDQAEVEIEARDAAIRAEEREAMRQILRTVEGGRCALLSAINRRAQPAERAKKTGDERLYDGFLGEDDEP